MSEAIFLVGIPTSGKSTYVQKLKEQECWENAVVLSTDDYIEKEAQKLGRTYNEIFDETISDATKELELKLRYAIQNNFNIIYDQTNLTIKTRKKKLSKIPDYYHKTAVYFEISLEESLERNEKREGKYIPKSVLKRMFHQFEIPSIEEGFNFVECGNK